MNELLKKFNYKGQKRIAILNASDEFAGTIGGSEEGLQVDREIDPRFPYEFMIVFVRFVCEIESIAPKALHNLVTDGTLWFVFPKKTSRKHQSDIYSDHGWEVLLDRGFDRVRQISVDDNWAGLKFRNVRFIRSPRIEIER